MFNFRSLLLISKKRCAKWRNAKESGNIRRVFLAVLLSGRLTNGTGEGKNRKMQSSFLSVCAQTALTLRARTRSHVISNGTIFLQPWLQMESIRQFKIAIELALPFFFSFIEFVQEEYISLFKEYYYIYEICIHKCYFSVQFRYCYKWVWILFSTYFLIITN